MASEAIEEVSRSTTVDESLWWESFVTIFEDIDSASLYSDLSDELMKRLKINRTWMLELVTPFITILEDLDAAPAAPPSSDLPALNKLKISMLESITPFKSSNEASKVALNFSQISIGSHWLFVKPELKEAALRVSACLCLDEVQSYILVGRVCELNESVADFGSQYFLHMVLLQYCHERQCLLKCIRHICVHALYLNNVPFSSNAIVAVATQLVHDGLENKLLSVVIELLSSTNSEKSEDTVQVQLVGEPTGESQQTVVGNTPQQDTGKGKRKHTSVGKTKSVPRGRNVQLALTADQPECPAVVLKQNVILIIGEPSNGQLGVKGKLLNLFPDPYQSSQNQISFEGKTYELVVVSSLAVAAGLNISAAIQPCMEVKGIIFCFKIYEAPERKKFLDWNHFLRRVFPEALLIVNATSHEFVDPNADLIADAWIFDTVVTFFKTFYVTDGTLKDGTPGGKSYENQLVTVMQMISVEE